MALYTFASATEELVRRMGGRTDINSRAAAWLDAAQAKFANSVIDIPQLAEDQTLTVVDGQSEYDLRTTVPDVSDAIGIQSIRAEVSGYRLTRFPYNQFRSITQQASGEPKRWARRGYTLAFDPEPNDDYALSIQYRRKPTLGTLEVEDAWQEDLIKLGLYIGYSALQKHTEARTVLTELPLTLQAIVSQPLDQPQWEAWYDDDLSITPMWE